MDFLEEIRELVKRVKTEKDRVLASFFMTEHLAFIFARNNPEMTRSRLRLTIRTSFKVVMGRSLIKEDLAEIKKVYANTRPAVFELPEEPADRRGKMNDLVENYHRVLMFGPTMSDERLFRTAPREVAYEYVQRNIGHFRRNTLDRVK